MTNKLIIWTLALILALTLATSLIPAPLPMLWREQELRVCKGMDAVPTLGGLPDTIRFVHSTTDQATYPPSYTLRPQNISTADPLTWTMTTNLHQLSPRMPLTGTTPQAITLAPTGLQTLFTSNIYQGALTVTVLAPTTTLDTPHTITVTVVITDTLFHSLFLPLALSVSESAVPSNVPNDPDYARQWGLDKVRAPQAWSLSQGDGVLVAVLDTGADFNHADLAGKLRADVDKDYVNNDENAQDDHGHGTHISGIIAATTDNNLGVAGLGWHANVLPLKVLAHDGNGYIADLGEAIYDATDLGAKVINLSMGTPPSKPYYCTDYPYLVDALRYAYEHNVLTVVSAGNYNTDPAKVLPANCPYVLAVAATDNQDHRASFSDHGAAVDIAAPGTTIYSTYFPNTYANNSGTSMAAPFVCGLAALIWAKYPAYTPEQVSAAILDHAVDLGEPGWDENFGCGRIDAAASVINGTTQTKSTCKPNALIGQPLTTTLHREATDITAYALGQLIIMPQPNTNVATLQMHGLTLQHTLPSGALLVHVTPGEEWATARRLMRQDQVAYAHPNILVTLQ